ncbi:MAG: hypothetical protein FD163_2533 [Hyphomonadaceae bacterium]|nr:MAG: hypothetical protein FD128_2853 [Hyphomonadaceae bacterium]KAF0182668.1 MAG: hypothetical protein FD163_2533 [Hyphomonadaceae bacterium]
MKSGLFANYREIDMNGWRWPHFDPVELHCDCSKHCKGEYFHDEKFLDALEKLRLIMGSPIVINSGRRCPKHNKAVGGASQSMHMKSIAVDIKIAPHDRKKLYEAAIAAGFNGLGFGVNFLHVDVGVRRRWTYLGGLAIWKRALGFDPVKR